MAIRTLEVALVGLGVAGKGGLGLLVLELVEDLPVGDVTHLEVLLDQLAVLVAHSALAIGHQRVAGVVGLADIAVDAGPTVLALALCFGPAWCSFFAVCKRAAQRF